MEPILGGLLGGVARLAPEVIGFFDKRNARKHELKMLEHQRELIKLKGSTRLDEGAFNAMLIRAREQGGVTRKPCAGRGF